MFLLRLVKKLNQQKVKFAVAGGYAVALHGAVRGTIDIDLVLPWSKPQLRAAEIALKSLGLQPRLPLLSDEVFEFRDEYRKNRNLTAWSFVNSNNPLELVDILLTADLKKIKTKTVIIQGLAVQIVSLADLIRMKKTAGRQQDLADVEALEKLK